MEEKRGSFRKDSSLIFMFKVSNVFMSAHLLRKQALWGQMQIYMGTRTVQLELKGRHLVDIKLSLSITVHHTDRHAQTHVHAYIHTAIYVHACTHTVRYVHACNHTHTHMHSYIYTCKYTHSGMHEETHTNPHQPTKHKSWSCSQTHRGMQDPFKPLALDEVLMTMLLWIHIRVMKRFGREPDIYDGETGLFSLHRPSSA